MPSSSLSAKPHQPIAADFTIAVNHQTLSFKQALRYLQTAGKLQFVLSELVSRYVLEQEFQQRTDLTVAAAELEQAIATLREANNLTDSQHFQTWLVDNGLDEATFLAQVEFDLKLGKLKVQLAEPKLLEAFVENKLWLDQAVISRILVESRDLAEEIKDQILEAGMSFEQLAQEYSQGNEAVMNGMVGVVKRAEIQQAIGVDVYQSHPGGLLEPIFCEGYWWLVRVEKLLPANWNEAAKQLLQDQIFEQWLSTKMQTLTIDLNLS